MILTEEEALRRRCPVRTAQRTLSLEEITERYQPGTLPLGAIPTTTNFAACIGEQCMAWRWEEPGMDSRKMPDSYRADDGPRGYCGMAGTPVLLKS
jgi:hypothetical protein